MFTQLGGVLLALSAALSWGGGDFSGGYAARKNHHFQVLYLSTTCSLLALLLLAALWREGLPTFKDVLLAASAGASGALGLAVLYRGLARGRAALVSPLAAVVGAAIPVLAGTAVDGFPGVEKTGGFLLALAGIWLVSSSHRSVDDGNTRQSIGYGLMAGMGFGGFLTLIAMVQTEQVFAPLVTAKAAALLIALLLLRASKIAIPPLKASPLALLAGALDAGGNVLYLSATHFTRLDIVAILASLYPASTVLLAMLILHEKVTPVQWVGVTACLGAIMLISS